MSQYLYSLADFFEQEEKVAILKPFLLTLVLMLILGKQHY
jgi:hypothetical protein